MLLAVLERRAGLKLSQMEAYMNVVGGVTVELVDAPTDAGARC